MSGHSVRIGAPEVDLDLMPEADDEDVWRYERLRELGVGIWESLGVISSRKSWHDVADLIDRGCPPNLAAEIAT